MQVIAVGSIDQTTCRVEAQLCNGSAHHHGRAFRKIVNLVAVRLSSELCEMPLSH